MPYRSLSLDLGTNLGYAFAVDGVIIESNTAYLKDAADHKGRRYENFRNFLQEAACEVDDIFIEKINSAGKFSVSIQVYHGLLAYLEEHLYKLPHIGFESVAVNTLKKYITGNGHASKVQMCEAMILRGWPDGVMGSDQYNDEADALAVMAYFLDRKGLTMKFGEDYGN